MIPKRFIRVWIGSRPIPETFEGWWQQFQDMHPGWEFKTLTDFFEVEVPKEIKKIIPDIKTCAGVSDILRLLAVYDLGGIYVDTDVMPLKPMDELLNTDQPFLGKRSSVSFESAVIGSPPKHPAIKAVLDALPDFYHANLDKTASAQTGPAFVSSVLFGRDDVTHYPMNYFYPYNGFMAPKREQKYEIFSSRENFPAEMYCAHFSNHIWGGKPW